MEVSIPFFRSRFPLAVAIAYLVPLLFWSFFVLRYVPETIGFWSLGLGWLLMAVGTLLVYCTGAEKSVIEVEKTVVNETKIESPPADEHYVQQIDELTKELGNARDQGIQNLQELQKTVSMQREKIEKQAVVIDQFESKFGAVSKELLSLLQAHREGKTNKVTGEHLFNFLQKTNKSTQDVEREADVILKRCLKIAEQHTSAWSFNPQMTKSSNTLDSYALDQRRFYQALSQEKKGVVFVYSTSDSKLLFVNQAAKQFLGWNPELFAQDFHELIGKGENLWKNALESVKEKGEVTINLPVKQSNREEILCHCQIGSIAKGLFEGQVLGVLLV